MNDPLLILADEPTGNLDSRSSEAVIEAFLAAQRNLDATIFMVTHDSFSASYCDRVIVMKDGKIYKELIRTGDRRTFLDELLTELKIINGGDGSFSASYCDRVIVMKDGKIYKELIRTGDRRTFLDELLTELKIINGGDGDEDE